MGRELAPLARRLTLKRFSGVEPETWFTRRVGGHGSSENSGGLSRRCGKKRALAGMVAVAEVVTKKAMIRRALVQSPPRRILARTDSEGETCAPRSFLLSA
ncbi:MAG: hypothetical protein RL077_4837 [Verrucomicrobiota bacterium]